MRTTLVNCNNYNVNCKKVADSETTSRYKRAYRIALDMPTSRVGCDPTGRPANARSKHQIFSLLKIGTHRHNMRTSSFENALNRVVLNPRLDLVFSSWTCWRLNGHIWSVIETHRKRKPIVRIHVGISTSVMANYKFHEPITNRPTQKPNSRCLVGPILVYRGSGFASFYHEVPCRNYTVVST